MKDLIIDKNYEGIVINGLYYKYNGDIKYDGNIIIKIPLYVSGSIEAGGWIKAGGSIEAGGWIEAGWSIKAGEWIEAGGSIEAKIIKMQGEETQKLLIITGLFYTMWLLDDHIKIGCQMKSKQEWIKFAETATESDAKALGDNGEMWAMRDFILTLARS